MGDVLDFKKDRLLVCV